MCVYNTIYTQLWLTFKKAKSLRPLHNRLAFPNKPTEPTALPGRPQGPRTVHWHMTQLPPDQEGLGSGFDLGARGHYQGGGGGGGSGGSRSSS